MRIIHVVHQYLPEKIGGTELHTQEVATRQAANGHDVHIIYPSQQNEMDVQVDVERGVTIHRVSMGRKTQNALLGRTTVFLNSFFRPKLLQTFAQLLPGTDLVHIQHLMGLPLAIADRCRAAHVPYIITLHDYWFPCANAQLYTNYDQTICDGPDARFHNCGRCAVARVGLKQTEWLAHGVAPLMGYRQRQLRPVFAGAARIIAPTRFVQTIYEQNGFSSDNLIVLRHGIDVPTAKIAAAKRSAVRDDTFHVVFVGSIAAQKGVHVLIEALTQLPDVRLTVAGGLETFPTYTARLQAMAAKSANIDLIGRIPHDDIWALLARADVVVLPTLWYEASPLTIDEFFAAGVPIIASNIGAMTEKIRHKLDGYLVPPNDVDALRQAIKTLMATPHLLQQMREQIGPVRTMETYVAELQAIYTAVRQPPTS